MSAIHGTRIDLDPLWFKTAKIPEIFREASFDKIHEGKAKEYAKKYLDNISKMVGSGIGLFITGKEGVGKSAMAAILATEAAHYRYTVTRFTFEEARSTKIDDRTEYNSDGQLVVDRLQSVDLLILDDFDHDFVDDKVFGAERVRRLIAARTGAKKTTIMTSRILPVDINGSSTRIEKKHLFKDLHSQMKESMVSVVLDGPNWRDKKNNEIKKLFE